MKIIIFVFLLFSLSNSLNIYWIGNSYSMNNLVGIFKRLGNHINLNIKSQLVGGASLPQHSLLESVKIELQKKWDYIILQDQSIQPAIESRRNETIKVLNQFYKPLISETRSNIVLYQTWGRR
jgi:hypothetical protein